MNVHLRLSTRRMIEQSSAAEEACSFMEWLQAERYTDYTIDCHLRRLLHVMPRLCQDAAPPLLGHAQLASVFDRERQNAGRFKDFSGTRRVYTRYLRTNGRLLTKPEPPQADLIRRYECYLVEVRGLTASSRRRHLLTLRHLFEHIQAERRSLERLSRKHIERLILERSGQISRHSLQHEVAHLKAFLRYAHDTGLVVHRLDDLDSPRIYRGELPPRALPWSSVLRLLRSIDRTSALGWRDACILHLIAYYGLRPGEVVSLRLDSIDWDRKLLHVYQSKTRSALTLPLDTCTARLLQGYLRHGRVGIATDSPMLFLRFRCPYIPLESSAVGDVFRKRMREAGLPDHAKHVYRLRHTFAMRLLQRGVGMKAIGDVLGHRSFHGTSAYLRLDVAMLREVALPVPARQGAGHA